MEKTIKLRSQFLSSLNEALQKLNLNDKVTKFTPVIVEADGKFTSIVKTDDTFDPSSLNNNVDSEEENDTPETKETKQQLLNKATDSLKQTLKNSKELEDILKKIKDLAKEDGYSEWIVNKQGNTASLKSKNAYIFKQNDNLCLSHNGKVELFKSVAELRKWLEENNYPLPKSDVVIHESTLTEDDKNINPALTAFLNRFKTKPEDILKKNSLPNKEGYLIKHEGKYLKNDFEKTLTELENYNNRYYHCIQELELSKTKEKEKEIKDIKDIITLNINNLFVDDINNAAKFSKAYDTNALKAYIQTVTDAQIQGDSLRVLKDDILPVTHDVKIRTHRDITKTDIGLSKRIAPEMFKGRPTKDPAVIRPINFELDPEDSIDECFGGVGVANLGTAVQYLGNKKTKTKKKDKKEPLTERFYRSLIPNRTPSGNKGNDVKAFIRWFAKQSVNNLLDGKYTEKDGTIHPLPDDWSQYIKHPDIKNFIDKYEQSMIATNAQHGDWPAAVQSFLDNQIKSLVSVLKNKDLKNNGMISKSDEEFKLEAENIIKNQNCPVSLKEIEDFLIKKVGGEFNNHLYTNENDTIQLRDIKNELSMLAKNPNKGKYASFWKEWQQHNTKDTGDKTLAVGYRKFKDWINGTREAEEVEKDPRLEQLRQIFPNKTEEQLLAMLRESKMENVKLNVFESAKNYPWLNKLVGQRLVEDDSPADFAKGSPIASDVGGDTGNPEVSINSDSSQGDGDIPTVDFAGEAEGMPGSGFGDVDISVGGGDYGPEGDEEQMPIPNMPEYQIIDVLTNDDDPTDIKVKVQNVETKEVEIKNLDEIDV